MTTTTTSTSRDGFVEPVMTGPIDVDAHVALVQPGATVKGMQFQGLLDECAAHGRPIAGRRYVSFRDCPGTELVELLALTAERVWPNESPREGLRRVGRIAYPTLRRSLVGKVLFGALGKDVPRLWALIAKGYALSANTGKATVLELQEREVIIRLEDMYSFIDAWHVGILEGAVSTYGSTPSVKIQNAIANSGRLLDHVDAPAITPHRTKIGANDGRSVVNAFDGSQSSTD